MIKRPVLPRSLGAQIVYLVLLALLTAALLYVTVYGLGTMALRRIYLSPEAVSTRQAAYYADLYRYVSEEQLVGDNGQAIAQWTRENPYVTLLLFRDNELQMRITEGRVYLANDMQDSERLLYVNQYSRIYPLRFADSMYQVAIGDSTDVREDRLNAVLAVVIAAAGFFAVLLWYVHRLSRRIVLLSREAGAIGGGDLEHPITVSGEDELAALAGDVDSMRHAIIERMGNERRAWEANSELITAISHDIRTPMTALIGYLGLLNSGGFETPEQRQQFTSSAYGKAMELKDLTDELFRYFLVFGRAELELNMEQLDACLLMEQLLGEAEFELRDAGFSVERTEFEGECSLRADPLYLKRVLDNLVSNAKKYADRDSPVLFATELDAGRISVCLSNRLGAARERAESTRIGLRTCEKIMQAMGGSFSARREGEQFVAEFTLPALPPL